MDTNIEKIIPVVLCGGFGNRLWPLSKSEKPKQFLPLVSKSTPFEETIKRAMLIATEGLIIIVASIKNKKIINNIIRGFKVKIIIIYEPIPKNTAPAIWFSAKLVSERFKNCNIIFLPSDHYINPEKRFAKDIHRVLTKKTNFNWILFGIKPSFPSTGFGYIKAKNNNVIEFVEKPNQTKANKYFKLSSYFWNTGIFLGKTERILSSFYRNSTSLHISCEKS